MKFWPPVIESIFNQDFVVFHQVKKKTYIQTLMNSGQIDEQVRTEARLRGLEHNYWAILRKHDQSNDFN